jgi:DNA-binding transcriptional LysR family regulator
MPELRESFEAGAPDVRVAQVEDDHEGLMARLLDGALDLALTYDLPRPPGIGFEPLAALAPHVMLAAGHPLAAAAFVTPADLAPHPMVLLDLPGSTGYFLSGFEAAGLAPRVAVRTADMALARSMVANGFGYGLVNVRPLSDLAPDGKRVEYRPLRDGPGPLVMGLARAEGAGRTRVVAAFEAHARARITPDGIPGLRMGA